MMVVCVIFLYVSMTMLYMYYIDLLILKTKYPPKIMLRYVGLL